MSAIRYLLIFAIVLLPASLFATTFPVTKATDTDDGICDPDCSLREAIGAANVNPGADDVPVPAGTYLLTLGELVVSDDVNISGEDQASTIFDGNHSSRVFKIDSGTVAEIEGVTIRNGAPYALYGGGIVNNGDLTLAHCTVVGNRATDNWYNGIGGGIFNDGGALNLTDSTVLYNSTAGSGGGIYNRTGTVSLTNSTVSGNRTGDAGGGVWSRGTLIVANSTVSNNYVVNDYFHGRGGGISNSGDLTITNSTVSGNRAGYGYYGYASGWGGGIHHGLGSATISNSTITGNGVNTDGGGIHHGSGSLVLRNTIVAGNDINNCSSGIESQGYNLADDASCGFSVASDLVVEDAMLGPLADNGGPTETHATLPGSPAIDAGSVDCPPPDTDQRGVARPQDATCDIGAVEYLPEPSGWLLLATGVGALVVLRKVG